MDRKVRVINCPVTALEERFNSLDGLHAILAQHWYEKPDGLWVALVLVPVRNAGNIEVPSINGLRRG